MLYGMVGRLFDSEKKMCMIGVVRFLIVVCFLIMVSLMFWSLMRDLFGCRLIVCIKVFMMVVLKCFFFEDCISICKVVVGMEVVIKLLGLIGEFLLVVVFVILVLYIYVVG